MDRTLFSTIRLFYSTFNEPNFKCRRPNMIEYTAVIFKYNVSNAENNIDLYRVSRRKWNCYIMSLPRDAFCLRPEALFKYNN